MYLPKADIYNTLVALKSQQGFSGLEVYQTQPEIFNSLPAITFYVGNNAVESDLANDIQYQDITIIIDIWGRTSSECSNILSIVENTMRANLYSLDYSADVPNADDNVKHINCRFTTKI